MEITDNNPQTLKEAWENLENAIRELCEVSLKAGVVMNELNAQIRKIKRIDRLNASRKSYLSPYVIFDKFRKRKR